LILSAEIDFLGVNYYVPRRVKARESEYDLDYFTPAVVGGEDLAQRFREFMFYQRVKEAAVKKQVGIPAFNIMLAHAKAVTAYRELALAGEIGVVLNLTPS
jgi:beta-glucosidase/6-phospho-beta-glucosidase/beta-galactosidase